MRALFFLALGLVVASSISADAQKLTGGADEALIRKAKAAIVESLKDGRSAQFRQVRKASDTDRARICGEVNAKNGYGGYVGFHRFVYFPDTGEAEILNEDFPSPDFVREKAKLFGSCF